LFTLSWVSRFLVCVVLVVSPLLLGSNRALFWALNGVIVSLALCFFVATEFAREKRLGSDWSLPKHLLILYGMPVVWMLVQLIPYVPSPFAHPAWQSVTDATPRMTVSPDQTLLTLLWWLPMGLAFIMVRAGTRQGGSAFYLRLMLVVSLCVAVFGLLNSYFDWGSVGILDKVNYKQWLTGTFVNRNSAASFLVIGLTIAMTLACQTLTARTQQMRGQSAVSQLTVLVTTSTTLYFSAVCVLFVAIFLTGSRAGVASALLASVLVILSLFYPALVARKSRIVLLLGVVAVVGIFGLSALLLRFEDGTGSSFARVVLAQEAIAAILDRPLLGHGAGSFQTIEPLYRLDGNGIAFVFNHAHNSYLEAAASYGLPFVLAWLGTFAYLLIRIFTKIRNHWHASLSGVVLFAIIIAEGLHALVDFSFEVQSIALYCSALLGLAIGEAMNVRETRIAPSKDGNQFKSTFRTKQLKQI
jgi:O-antigen ligase